MNAAGQEKQKEATLKTNLAELLELDQEVQEGELYADLTITCVKKGDENATILEGVPPLRVKLA